MLKLPRKTRTTHPPSPLQPYVDSGAGPGWMLAAHVVEKLPKTLLFWVAQPQLTRGSSGRQAQ